MKVYIVIPVDIDEDDFGTYPANIRVEKDDTKRAVQMLNWDLEKSNVISVMDTYDVEDTSAYAVASVPDAAE